MNNKQKEYLQRYQEEFIELLPDMSEFANKYFVKHFNQFKNVVDSWDEDPIPEGYTLESFEIYYGTSNVAQVCVVDGVLKQYELPEFEENNSSVTIMANANCVYIEIQGKEVLNKIRGVIFPQVIANPSVLLNNIINGDIS
ncbi:hypothetical protein WKK05_37600 (plasmid) [Nostoc sp. UHCC 0302]|uniref:hypothetical protein n=1 Tax=Nostoc sp. UHCC 0302 TaxID=3134896 RepID=UPI00311CCD10